VSLSDFIENLQNKPRPVRIFILWSSVTVCAAIIFIFWITSFGGVGEKKPTSGLVGQSQESVADINKEIPTLWQSLKASIGELFQSTPNQTNDQEPVPKIEIESSGGNDQVSPTTLP
jgi:hypothetical protein